MKGHFKAATGFTLVELLVDPPAGYDYQWSAN
jgi:hypothetical protein